MTPENQASDLGYLGHNGVLVVPAPSDEGAWLVTLARWDDEQETYTATSDGPLFEDRGEAMQEAERIIAWLSEHQDDDDIVRAWDVMRQEMARQNMPDEGSRLRLGPFFPGI